MKKLLIILLIVYSWPAFAQNMSKYGYDFDLLPKVIENGDTFMLASTLNEVRVIPQPELSNLAEMKAFYRLKRHTINVYHYAQMAKEIYMDINDVTTELNRRKRKRYINQTEKELKEQFSEELKNLSQSEGRVLVKLINRETGDDCYGLIKELKSGLAAFFWQRVAKLYDYDLKAPYLAEENSDLEYIIFMIEIGEYKLPQLEPNS